MAEIKKEAKQEYEILRQGSEEVMKIDYSKSTFTASLEGDADVMAKTIDKLIEVPSVSRIILNQRKNYEYDFEQTSMLKELSSLYNYLIRQRKILGYINSGPDQECQQCYPDGYNELRYVVYNMIKGDPIGAYVQVKRLMRQERIAMDKGNDRLVRCRQRYLNLLSYLFELLGRLKIVKEVKDNLDGHVIGDREIYSLVLRPSITPNFMFTKLMSEPPKNGIELDAYSVKGNDIVIYKIPGEVKNLYHITPPEFKISEDRYMLLDLARSVLAKYEPRAEEFTDPSRMRRTFYNIGMDLLQELADNKGIEISLDELKELSNILVRYTVGFGLIEILLNDDKIQDVVVNSPIGQTNAFIVHQDYDECVTNIIPAKEDGDSWATKFRLLSGRPLDEANPVLDTELTLENARARASIMTRPLNPLGLSFSFRRHRDTPWTLPLFIKAGMINPLAAGLMSFFIDGARTMLIAGTRGSGKTSLLDASLLEIMRKFRIITVEDTLELSTRRLRELGYNLQTMKVRAALMSGGTEVAADEGIRTSLRMGDSCLIVGEVRSLEAAALYEAMRVGALANVVAGTIHGGTPYGVFDRVVNDLKVPRTSFKATDIIIIAIPIRSPDGLKKYRRVTQITEVRKNWENDPEKEHGFVDLMRYNVKTDQLEPTDELINGDSEVIKAIAGNVKEWAGDWDAVWENILLRAKIKQKLVEYAIKLKRDDILEADFVAKNNDIFHELINDVRETQGKLDNKLVFKKWDEWIKAFLKSSKK